MCPVSCTPRRSLCWVAHLRNEDLLEKSKGEPTLVILSMHFETVIEQKHSYIFFGSSF